nr:hypothetical protein B0A51_13113 [Rachicladosporium sp. CCFEE 5018]
MESDPRAVSRNPTHTHGMNGRTNLRREGTSEAGPASSAVAHTLTACTRCRQRKTRCDPNLPKCGPCERTNSVCEYFDSNKGHVVNRNYVVYLQHKVRELEEDLERVENEDTADDPEAMMRSANVRMQDMGESKFLGPSSGIAITRLVMQLAKQFTDAKSIKEIVPEARAKAMKQLYIEEQAKPTSKIYPVTSNVAAPDLPNRGLTDVLVQLYKLKVQPLYPALHEPTLDADVAAVYENSERASHFQNFVTRMVIAISLQKMDTQYAGLADSFYLAALQHLEDCMRPMDLKTLQCFALMAEYSLLTPTRTAIYYIVGIAVRLVQALGYNEEKTITRGTTDSRADPLEIDMRRRAFWCVLVMELGLAHSLGRPSIMATSQEHIDVGWFELCDDKYITRNGIDPAARSERPTLKKWIAMHFFKMRFLQLEIRRKLYQRKRSEPKDDSDPWSRQMEAKLTAWRDASPNDDEGHGLDKTWFTVRYNTIVVFLYRPSPQISRPSLAAALKAFDACQYNIYIQREQIIKKNVDLTWVFAQALFMAINTMLWSLSYVEVRRKHSKTDVESHLDIAMQAIQLASERWPGVASAIQLYQNLIVAVLRIYEKDGDVPISAVTPSESASPAFPIHRADTSSPATASSNSAPTPPERSAAPFGYLNQQSRRSVEQPPPVPYQSSATPPPAATNTPPLHAPPLQALPGAADASYYHQQPLNGNQPFQPQPYDLTNQWSTLPEFTADLTAPGWNAAYTMPHGNSQPFAPPLSQQLPYETYTDPYYDPNTMSYPFPNAGAGSLGVDTRMGNDQYMQPFWEDSNSWTNGLDASQQQELMHSLETSGMEDIQTMITATVQAMTPKPS